MSTGSWSTRPITDPEIVNAITGRATEAHFLITDLPTTRHSLHATIAEEDDESKRLSATLTAAPNTIGSILIELTSDESLLDRRGGAGRAGDEHRRRPALSGTSTTVTPTRSSRSRTLT